MGELDHAAILTLLVFLPYLFLSEALSFLAKPKSIMGQAIASSQFYVYGRRHFTRSGYLKHIAQYEAPVQDSAEVCRNEKGADGVDLAGKVIVITGKWVHICTDSNVRTCNVLDYNALHVKSANSGVGNQLATYAAAKGAKVYMMCRSAERAERARNKIVEKTSNDQIHVILADVGELQQVRKAAKELAALEDDIDCLVCNAGVLLHDRRESSEGNEITFASHFLGGSYLLSKLLLPRLKASAEPKKGRVVFVSSGGMYTTKFPSWDVATSTRRHEYNGNMAYAYSKRGQVLLAERWTRDHPEVLWVTGHPGWVDTPALEEAYGSSRDYLRPLRSPWEGAEGLAWLMSTECDNLTSGAFYLDRRPDRKHLGGWFMTEGSFTKNTDAEVDEMMENLEKASSK